MRFTPLTDPPETRRMLSGLRPVLDQEGLEKRTGGGRISVRDGFDAYAASRGRALKNDGPIASNVERVEVIFAAGRGDRRAIERLDKQARDLLDSADATTNTRDPLPARCAGPQGSALCAAYGIGDSRPVVIVPPSDSRETPDPHTRAADETTLLKESNE